MSYQSFLDRGSLRKNEYFIGSSKFGTLLEETDKAYHVIIFSTLDHLVLHWGIGVNKAREWVCPLDFPLITLPPNTTKFDEKAAQSPFLSPSSNLSNIEVVFSKESLPLQLNFVLKHENSWFNNSGSDYCVILKEPILKGIGKINDENLKALISEIVEAETSGGAWTLMHRFNLCNSWINRIGGNSEGLAWIFVWMRYSAQRKLDWQRNYNTRPSELASSQKNLTFTLSGLLKNQNIEGLANNSMIVRGILGTMGKGGDNGQRIRDEILHIMHRHKIKIHNPKLALENYYEQWHQKLHNNTTPDDIGICEAIIAYNESSNMAKYWEVLSRHGLTKERLASFDRPINVEPYLAPQIVPDLYNYLALLKAVHGSAELTHSIDCCRSFLSPIANSKLTEIASSLAHWDKIEQMSKVLDARKEIHTNLSSRNVDQFREIIYLDLALESYMRQLCEEIIHLDIDIVSLCRELGILLESIQINAWTEEMQMAITDYLQFYKLFSNSIYEKPHGLILKASCDRLQRLLGSFVDAYNSKLDPKARYLGSQFLIDQETIDLFTEELIRGSLFFAVSLVLRKVDTAFRKICQLKPWQIISPRASAKGILTYVDSLHSVAYEKYSVPVVLICNKVTGEEEIPDGAVAVICSTELDVLAHVCVRARNNKVLLAICFDSEIIREITGLVGMWVEAVNSSVGISLNKTEASSEKTMTSLQREVKKPLPLQEIVLKSEEFLEGRTGAKANNCAELQKRLPGHVGVPSSVALPYGTFEYFLLQAENESFHHEIENLLLQLTESSNSSTFESTLSLLKAETKKLTISYNSAETIQNLLETIGCKKSAWDLAWTAIKQVWASKFNERVYLALLKSKISIEAVVMSVLCQEVISADYAFVLHTKNPMTNNSEEIYGELVIGLGETLVGAYEGRALGFISNKSTGKLEIQSFPSKSVCLKGSGFIFRSDSNSEDLPGFAGAGLFDSYIMDPAKEEIISYSKCEIVLNSAIREFLLKKVSEVGVLIEEIFCGVPQDIEGVIKNQQIFIVQSRPQV